MTVKSIFVPESYLREEIRVGYDQAGGTAEPEKAPLVQFQPVQEADATDGAGADVADAADVAGGADADGADDEAEPAAALFEADSDSGSVVDDPAQDDLEPVQDPKSFDIFDDITKIGERDDHVDAPAMGGGLFGSDFATVLQTMMVSGNNMPIADSIEDAVYELNGIKSYLDSIAQSLANIAEKYAGDGYGNKRQDRQDRQDKGNKPWNNDRGNKPWNNDKGNRGQDRQDSDPEAAVEDGLDE
jgi:hypothetical protein